MKINVEVIDSYGEVVYDFNLTDVENEDLLVNDTYNIPKIVEQLNTVYGVCE